MANTKITSNVIANNAVGIAALNVSDGSNGQVLSTNGSGTLSFATVSGTTINNNADNRIITGSGTANTLNGEANFVFDGSNVGIGTSTLNKIFNIADPNQGGETLKLHFEAESSADKWAIYSYDRTNGHYADMSFGGNYLYLKSGGNVGIGTSSPEQVFHVYQAGDGKRPVRFTTGNNKDLDFYNDSEGWQIQSEKGLYHRAKGGGMFRVITGAGTDDTENERLRITTGGAFKVKQGTSAYANATSNYNEICSNADATANLLVRQGSTYYADCINLWYYASTGPNNTHSSFLNAFDQQGTRAKIFSNGGFANYQSNNSNL